jgi:ribonuclease HI
MDYYVYTDGACSNNGRPNAKAGYGIYFGENDTRNVSKAIIGKQTNNIAELTAIIESYSLIEADLVSGKTICIMSDSIYAIRCAGEYGEKCSRKNWGVGKKKPIPNVLLVKKAFELYKDSLSGGMSSGGQVVFKHVLAHTGKRDVHSIGNDWADKLATGAIG